MSYYPVVLELEGRRCVVVGGALLAEHKVKGLLAAGAAVTVIAPEASPYLTEMATVGRIGLVPRKYEPGDLAGAYLVICATHDSAAVRLVWQEASEHGSLINTVDDTGHSNFVVPAVLRQGDLLVTVSTGGKSPALAVRLRERLARDLGPEYGRFLELTGALRPAVASAHLDHRERKARWQRLLDSDVLELLAHGDEARAHERMAEIMGVPIEETQV